HATQRVAEGMAVAALERLDHDLGAIAGEAFDLGATRAQDLVGGNRHSWCLLRNARGGRATLFELLRVELDDQRFVDLGRQVGAVRDRLEHAGELLRVDLDPRRRQVHLRGDGQRLLHAELLLRLLRQGDRVTGLDLVRRQVHELAVDGHAAVADQLARGRAGHGEAHAVDDVVQAGLQHLQEVLAGVALAGGGLLVIVAELALQQAIDALDLLLLAKLERVVRELAAAGAGAGTVLAGLLLQLALGVERAGRRLQAEVGAFATGALAG